MRLLLTLALAAGSAGFLRAEGRVTLADRGPARDASIPVRAATTALVRMGAVGAMPRASEPSPPPQIPDSPLPSPSPSGSGGEPAAPTQTAEPSPTPSATAVPLGVAEKAYEVAQLVKLLEPITNPNMKSDLTTASALARAAITGALANVEINLASLKDEAFAAEVRQRTSRLRS